VKTLERAHTIRGRSRAVTLPPSTPRRVRRSYCVRSGAGVHVRVRVRHLPLTRERPAVKIVGGGDRAILNLVLYDDG
jgi:hypothetical protein